MNRLGMTTAIAGALGLALVTVGCAGHSEGRQEGGRPPVAVDVATARAVELARSVEVVGQLMPKFSTDIKSEFTAVVEEVYVTEWVRVAKGTPLARLDTSEGKAVVEGARAGVLQAQVAEARAGRELERALKLKEYGLITQQALDDARSAQEAAGATTAVAKAQLDLAETRLAKAIIRAPMDGVVALRAVNPGDRVENMGGDVPMFRIVDNRVLQVTVGVPSSRLAELQVGQPFEFTTEGVPGRTFTGTVMFINPSIDAASRSVRLTADVRNDEGALRGGLFVKGRVLTGNRSAVLQVPRAALLSWDVERRVGEVFVVAGGVAERRRVRTGQTSGDAIEIVEGLSAGEAVVTRGAFNLKGGDPVVVAGPAGA